MTIPEFEDVTNNESIPVSYLAESIETTPRYGRASRIRIFNIDEGMSPVYYKGTEDQKTHVDYLLVENRKRIKEIISFDWSWQ